MEPQSSSPPGRAAPEKPPLPGVWPAVWPLGHSVLCIDMDIGLRNLDISLGLSDRALMASPMWRRDAALWSARR